MPNCALDTCGKEFVATAVSGKPQKYCSQLCRRRAIGKAFGKKHRAEALKSLTKNCKQCNDTFSPKKARMVYCPKCVAKEAERTHHTIKQCKCCNEGFLSNVAHQVYCKPYCAYMGSVVGAKERRHAASPPVRRQRMIEVIKPRVCEKRIHEVVPEPEPVDTLVKCNIGGCVSRLVVSVQELRMRDQRKTLRGWAIQNIGGIYAICPQCCITLDIKEHDSAI